MQVSLKAKITKQMAVAICLVFLIYSCTSSRKPQTYNNKSVKIDSTIVADSAFEAQIRPYRQKLDAIMNRQIGYSKVALTKGEGESLLGNFVADAIQQKAQKLTTQIVDMGAVNNGGLRSPLPKGKLTVGHVFELMPFENELVLVELSGIQMKAYFNYQIGKKLHISNTKVKAKGKYVAEAFINGVLLDTNKTYTIAMSDYMASSEPAFIKTVKQTKLNLKLRDLLIAYLEEKNALKDTINPVISGRLVIE